MSKKQKTGDKWERNFAACSKSLKSLSRMPQAGPFLVPVDWKALQLPTYPKIVKKPMDLGTISQKLEASRYPTVEAFVSDVMLVWSNARAFNTEGSDIYELAMQLEAEFKSKLEAVVRDIRKHKDAAAFLEPVDWKALGIKDYPTIIKRPMDLGTILKRLDGGGYASVLDVAADIDLVWSNAMTYNMDESPIYQVAAQLKEFADRKLSPLTAAARDAGDVPHELTFEMKRQLNENAALLSSKDLYGMVGIVEDTCKRAIDQTNPQEVEIDIDSLDLHTFLKVDKYVQDCIVRARKKSKM